jgi:DNA polymerase-3 subunit beta
MKVNCKQPELSRGLGIVGHAVSARSTLPVLANILLTTDGGRLKLSATNLEIGITCWVDAEVSEDGALTVPAKLLTELVSALPPETIELTLKDGHALAVKSRRTAATLKGLDTTEFPLIPTAEGSEAPVTLEAAQLKEMINQVAFSAATDDARPVFTGVLVQIGEETVTLVAADAFRLAVRTAPLAAPSHTQGDILIPAKTLTELARILPGEGHVQMIVTPNRSQVLFHAEGLELVSRLIDGQFPNYRQILPKGHTTRAVIDAAELRAVARAAALFARDSSNIVRLTVHKGEGTDLEPGNVILQATAEDVGDQTGVVSAAIDGQDLTVIFNVRYITEVLGVIDTPEIALELNTPQAPAVVRPVGGADYTYVMMPMHNIR